MLKLDLFNNRALICKKKKLSFNYFIKNGMKILILK